MIKRFLIFLLFSIAFTILLPGFIQAQQASEAQSYEVLMKSGSEKYANKDYISAKTYFEMALQAKNNNDDAAQKKLTETVEKIRQQMALQETFYSHLDYGDRLFDEQKLEEALTAYQEALAIFPDDKYTLARVESIHKTLSEEAEKINAYNTAMQLGEQLLSNNNYDEALLQFTNASALYPELPLPKEKIAETKSRLDALKRRFQQAEALSNEAKNMLVRKDYKAAIDKLNEAIKIYPEETSYTELLENARNLEERSVLYNKALSDADRYYAEKNFILARENYVQSLNIWPEQAYPADMIQRIDQTLKSSEYLADQAYNEALSEAQGFEKNNEWQLAISAYQKALSSKPNDALATEKIATLEGIITAQKASEEAEKQFADLLRNAEDAEARSDLESAISFYQQALHLKSDNVSIESKIANLQLKRSETAKAQARENQYANIIQKADSLMNIGNLNTARNAYEEALTFFNDRPYPAQQIEKIVILVKENELLAQKEAQFSDLMATAETLLGQGLLQDARQKYVEAFNLDPSKAEPQTKINEIDSLIAAEALAAAEKEDEFTRLIGLARAAYDNNKLEDALIYYQQASVIKPDVTDLQTQIGLVNQLITEQQQLEAREKNYQQFIADADRLLTENQLKEAKLSFQKAQNLFPDREYPAEKIMLIDGQIASAEAALVRESTYNRFISSGDSAFSLSDFQSAFTAYQSASAIKPDAEYPSLQLQKVQIQLDQIAKQKALDEAFTTAIAEADQLYVDENWTEAEISYQKASSLKPSETYPFDQIAAIKIKMDELAQAKALQQQVSQLLIKADQSFENKQYADAQATYDQVLLLDAANEIALTRSVALKILIEKEAQLRQQNYDQNIVQGDQFLSEKNYQDAITAYKTAIGYKPQDEYAATKIAQIDNILKERLLQLKTAYNKIISEADQYYQQNTFDKAIESYLKAKELGTNETYPQDMINLITKTIEENMLVELNRMPMTIQANNTKRFDFAPVNVTERRGNYILIKAKNNGSNNYPLIISFGSKNGRNGGFVLPIPEDQEYHDFVVRIGSQYKWFSEDNTWIEIYPENGSVELGLTQISKGN